MKTPLGLSLYLWLAVSDALISSNLGHLGDLAGFSQLLRWCVGRHRVPVDCQVKPFGIHAKPTLTHVTSDVDLSDRYSNLP